MSEFKHFNILIEGVDGTGKSTLAKGLARRFFHHSPIGLNSVGTLAKGPIGQAQSKTYYNKLFNIIANEQISFICDRSHLGEAVYSPLYRGYDGSYVYDFEAVLCEKPTLLVLLDNSIMSILLNREDGDSLSKGDLEKVTTERLNFWEAFNKSGLPKVYIDAADMTPGDVIDEVVYSLRDHHIAY